MTTDERAAEKHRADSIVEAMCRAICEAEGQDPDAQIGALKLWHMRYQECRAAYHQHVAREAMLRAMMKKNPVASYSLDDPEAFRNRAMPRPTDKGVL